MIAWQDFIALGIAAAALVYLARRLRHAGGGGGCASGGASAGCSACLGEPDAAPPSRLVLLDAPPRAPKAEPLDVPSTQPTAAGNAKPPNPAAPPDR